MKTSSFVVAASDDLDLLWLGVGIVVAALIICTIGGWLAGPRNCGVCGGPLKRVRYRVVIDGKKSVACATCGGNIQRRISKKVVDAASIEVPSGKRRR